MVSGCGPACKPAKLAASSRNSGFPLPQGFVLTPLAWGISLIHRTVPPLWEHLSSCTAPCKSAHFLPSLQDQVLVLTLIPGLKAWALPTIITGLDKFCFHAEVSKPRRGGLFIDTETPPDFSFCFSAARMWSNRAYMNTSTDGSSGQDIAPVAPPKNKKKIGGGVVSIYKQATPTGFSRRGRSVIGRR